MPATLQTSDAQSWTQWVTQFDAARARVQNDLNALVALQSVANAGTPEMRARYQRPVSDGRAQIAALNSLAEQRDNVSRWLNTIGRNFQIAVDTVTGNTAPKTTGKTLDFSTSPSKGLGAVPVVIVGVSLVAAAAVVVTAMNWAREAQNETRRLNEFRRLQAGGMSAEEAAATVASVLPDNGGIGALLGTNVAGIPVIGVILAAAAFFAIQKM